ncbi:MAG: 30S ribosomal protein S12 methylthiotransferase RimO [Acidimicrobiales bacterium]|nr:30S ribosomal protein S12 methylthiotransferase RimO [Acidimicrobiales bacterium]
MRRLPPPRPLRRSCRVETAFSPTSRLADGAGSVVADPLWAPQSADTSTLSSVSRTYWVETLGCPKNQVDSDKLEGTMLADGLSPAAGADSADVVVINTCAFIHSAREESVNTILALTEAKADGAQVVVTGCMAERYGEELAAALPEVAQVSGFGTSVSGTPVTLGATRSAASSPLPSFDLLNLPRPAANSPWAYVKIAEGCDRNCGFCAIPSFRGKQRSRSIDQILAEVEQTGAKEIVLVAQDLAAFGRDQGVGERQIVELVGAVAEAVDWVRLLYLYPSDLNDRLIEAICATGVPYFDLSLQHVSRPLVRRMRRWGEGSVFAERIDAIRAREPDAAFRSNFIVGYPGETEEDHDQLIRFVEDTRLDWCGFFSYSAEEGTYAVDLPDQIPAGLMADRLAELNELQDQITAERQDDRLGTTEVVLVEETGISRSVREAPEIDGLIHVPNHLAVGQFHHVEIVEAAGPDLTGVPT